MNYELPVVAVDLDGQRALINASDFDESVHQLWEDEKEAEGESGAAGESGAEAEASTAPAPKTRKNAAK